MSASIQGLDQLLRQLTALVPAVATAAETQTRTTADAIAATARELAPVKSGRLRGSIQVSKTGPGYQIGTDLTYAPGVELGLRGRPATPFLYPAFLLHQEQFLQNLKSAIRSLT
jgi:HK97 gp10 family phage protein